MSAPSIDTVAPGSASAYAFVPNLPQEVKFKDIDVALDPYAIPQGWHFVSSLNLHAITPGTGPSQRIGRSIRLVGIVARMSIENPPVRDPFLRPYTLDFIWDRTPDLNQLAPPSLAQIYGSADAPGIHPDLQYLPIPEHLSRFKFIKRVERCSKHVNSTLNFSHSCNELVTYSDSYIYRIPSIDLLITAVVPTVQGVSPQSPLFIRGVLRLLYVDA